MIDTDQVHPLTQLVQMGNVKIVEATPLVGPQGTVTLVDADIGPIYAVGPRAGYEDAVLAFELVRSRRRQARGQHRLADPPQLPGVRDERREVPGRRRGRAWPPRASSPASRRFCERRCPWRSVQVQSPRGDQFQVPREIAKHYIFGRTDELGVYDVREGSGQKVGQQFAVNLFDTRESDLAPARRSRSATRRSRPSKANKPPGRSCGSGCCSPRSAC